MDFLLSKSGDIVMEETVQQEGLTISYLISEHDTLAIKFHVLNEIDYPENEGLLITFIQSDKSDLTYHSKVITTLEEKIQLIRLSLETEKGQLSRRKDFGSLLKEQKHKDIHDTKNLAIIKKTVEETVSQYLDNPTVQVKPANGVGHLYYHNVEIKIYENDTQIFKFYL